MTKKASAVPPPPPSSDDLKDLLRQSIEQNRQAAAELPKQSDVQELAHKQRNTAFQVGLIWTLLGALAVIAGGLYLRVDDKISNEIKHQGQRVDDLIKSSKDCLSQ